MKADTTTFFTHSLIAVPYYVGPLIHAVCLTDYYFIHSMTTDIAIVCYTVVMYGYGSELNSNPPPPREIFHQLPESISLSIHANYHFSYIIFTLYTTLIKLLDYLCLNNTAMGLSTKDRIKMLLNSSDCGGAYGGSSELPAEYFRSSTEYDPNILYTAYKDKKDTYYTDKDDKEPNNGWWVVFLTAVVISIVIVAAVILSSHCK